MAPSTLLPQLIRILEELKLRYLITGSTASTLYGEPRFTNDIDVVVELPAARIDEFCNSFPPPEFYCSRQAVVDAVKQKFQFNVLVPESGMKIDVIIATTSEYDETRLRRALRLKDINGTEGSYAAPEDVIVKKMIYYREGGSEKHLRDIAGILKTSPIEIDRAYIARWATAFDCADIWARIQVASKATA